MGLGSTADLLDKEGVMSRSHLPLLTFGRPCPNRGVPFSRGSLVRVLRSLSLTACLSCLGSMVAAPAFAGINEWSGSVPLVSALEHVVVHPTEPEVLMAGTYSTLARSDDGGMTWTTVLQTGDGVLPLGWSPYDPSLFWAASTRVPILYLTRDRGLTWNQIAVPSRVRDLAFSPTDPQLLYIALAGIYEDCHLCPADSQHVARSTDGGWTWTQIGLETHGEHHNAVAVSPMRPTTLYVTTTDSVWKSSDAGETWRDVTPQPAGRDYLALALDPWDPEVLYVGNSDGVFKSEDGAASWTSLAGSPELVRDVAIHPQRPSLLLVATGMGILRSLDAGESWSEVRRFAGSLNAQNVAFDPLEPRRAYAVAIHDGLLRSLDQGTSWQILESDFTSRPWIRDVAVAESPGSPVYISVYDGGIFRSLDGGRTWKRRNRGLGSGQIDHLVVAPSNDNVLYAGGYDGFFRSRDGGSTWEEEWSLHGRTIHSLSVDPHHPGWLYFGANNKVLHSRDFGDTWTILAGPPLGETIQIDPTDPASLYRVWDSNLWISRNAGASWSYTSANPEPPIHWVGLAPDHPEIVFVSTIEGIFRSLDRGHTWSGPIPTGPCSPVPYPGIEELAVLDSENLVFLFRGQLCRTRDGGATWSLSPFPEQARRFFVNPWTPSTVFASGDHTFAERTEVDCEVSTARCFADDRFMIEMGWRDFSGRHGLARFQPFPSADSAVLWFFRPDNWEVLAKVIDGTAFNHRYWIFAATASNVETVMRVTDTLTGRARIYHNPLGQTAASLNDIEAFVDHPSIPPEGPLMTEVVPLGPTSPVDRRQGFDPDAVGRPCVPSGEHLCLIGGRFQVEATWTDFEGGVGAAHGVALDATPQDDSGLLWFFRPDNWELLVKVVDGCGYNQRHWVFAAATTNVGYVLKVTDTVTGEVVEYHNALGQSSPTVTDIEALSGCSP